ncbi:diguanylate cyclase domain-containing protein [Shewanella sp. UCD-KL12]|uniref:diguanylate cyclase domain-containing protein n=1 Tax=Shewanella sp. UCD-KL12 TaxID=1917163 RepID=UPI0009702E4C|nr:diguanylate cyclase [Shewanella sp. UCD-KL12]
MMKDNSQIEQSIYRLFEITPIPVVLSYPSGKLEYVNPAFNKMLGYENEQIYADGIIITHHDDIPINQEVRRQLTEKPYSPVTTEKRYLHKNGHAIYAQLNIVAQPDMEGNIVRYISQLVDLTNIRKSEAAEVLLNHLVNQSNDAIYVVDPKSGDFLNSNHLGYRRLGYSKQELLTLSVPHIHPALKQDGKWQQHVKNIKDNSSQVIESTHNRKDGTAIPIEANISFIEYNSAEYLIAIVRDISRRKQKELEVLEQANLDPLTNLPNRRIMEQKLTQLFAKAEQDTLFIAFIYIDLDKFKIINDTYGHTTGDGILKGAAKRLKACIRESDIITRLGGDEFLVVVNGFKKEEQVKLMTEKLLEKFNSPFHIGPNTLHVAASLGVAVYYGNNTDVQTLIQLADEAMYQAKQISGTSIYYL